MTGRDPAPPVRLAELVATLSLVSDLGMGLPMEHALRQCLIAMRLGDRMGLTPRPRGRAAPRHGQRRPAAQHAQVDPVRCGPYVPIA